MKKLLILLVFVCVSINLHADIIIEELFVSDYEVEICSASIIDPSKIICKVVCLQCPQCKKRNPVIKHGEFFHCDCGLLMEVWGNSLICNLVVPDKEDE